MALTIQEAVKTKCKLRPVGWHSDEWFTFEQEGFKDENGKYAAFLMSTIFGSWELKQEPRKVTLYQYLYNGSHNNVIYLSVENSLDWNGYKKHFNTSGELLKTFTREIGF